MLLRRCATVGLCLVGLFSRPEPAQAQNCRGVLNPSESVRNGGYAGSDGKVHYTIGYASGVADAQIGAMQSAINQWNHYSHVSGIVLEETSGRPDIQFRRSSSTSACAADEPSGSYIWYSEANMAWAGAHPHLAGRAYAHEIAHALGVHHQTGLSIMRAGNPDWNCQASR